MIEEFNLSELDSWSDKEIRDCKIWLKEAIIIGVENGEVRGYNPLSAILEIIKEEEERRKEEKKKENNQIITVKSLPAERAKSGN